MLETDPLFTELMSREALPDGTNLLGKQFTITKRMSAGGFGITYRARDNALGRDVVLKECFSEHYCVRSGKNVVAKSDEFQKQFRSVVKMFMREAQSLAKLRHPNIVGVHRVFEENGTAYMVLDLIDGNDLHDIIESSDQPLPPDLVIDILMRLLDAIEKVHEADLLHRDISPDNIIIDHDGNPVLIDFGAARSDASRRTRAISSLLVVKDGYSPKELYTAGSIQAPCSDLYALGATFYHVVSGEAPIDSQTRMASVASYKPDPCKPLAGRFDNYAPEFRAAIDQAMQTLPADRIQSAADWRSMMSKAVGGAPSAAPAADSETLKNSLISLVQETNEVVRKTRILEEQQASLPKEVAAKPNDRVTSSVPDWVDEFNRETEAGELSDDETPSDQDSVTTVNAPKNPQTSDWISRAREKQTRILQEQGLLPAVEEPEMSPEAIAEALGQPRNSQAIETEKVRVSRPAQEPEFSAGLLFKYLGIGLVIGTVLVLGMLQFMP